MNDKECSMIVDGLVVDDRGELVLSESYRKHLDECSQCLDIYRRINAAKTAEVPDYIPSVMQRIRDIEIEQTSISWVERLKKLFFAPAVFRPQILVPVAAIIAAVVIIFAFGYRLLPKKDGMDMTIATVTQSNVTAIRGRDSQKESMINGEISKQIRLNLAEALDSDNGV